MELKARVLLSDDTEKQTAELKNAGQRSPSLFPPAQLTLAQDRLLFQGFGYGRIGPVYYRKTSPLSLPLRDILRFGPTDCRRSSLIAAAVLSVLLALICLLALPGPSSPWLALLAVDLGLLSPAIFLTLFFRWPFRAFCVWTQKSCLRLPVRWCASKDFQSFQEALSQALSVQKAAPPAEQAALTLARAAALHEYAALRRQGLLTEEEFRQAKAQTLSPPRAGK